MQTWRPTALKIPLTCRLTLLSMVLPAALISTSDPEEVSAYTPPLAAPPGGETAALTSTKVQDLVEEGHDGWREEGRLQIMA